MTFADAFDPFRSLRSSWKVLRAAPLALLIGGLLLFLTDPGGSGGNFGGQFQREYDQHAGDVDAATRAFLVLLAGAVGFGLCCFAIGAFLVHSWIWIGFANTVERALRTGSTEVGALFDPRGRMPTMLITRLVGGVFETLCWIPLGLAIGAAILFRSSEAFPFVAAALALTGSFVSFCIWAYVGLGLSLAKPIVALEGLHPLDALNKSWTLVRGNRLALLWFYIVTVVVALFGFCLCCVGALATYTLFYTARVESYLLLTRGDDMNGWWSKTGQAPSAMNEEWGTRG